MSNTETQYYQNGYLEKTDIAANATITAAAALGIVQNFIANATVTLPAAAVGLKFRFRVGSGGLTAKIKPASTETMTGNGFTATASYILTLTNAPAGSFVELDGSSGNWNITGINLGAQNNGSVLTYAST